MSERPDGGRMGSTVVQDAVSNNIFPDVGSLALSGGRVWLRSGFMFVNQDGTDVATEAYMCITKPPSNPKAACALFTDQSWFSYEPEYRSYLESYLVNGVKLPGHLLDRQLINTQTLQLWMKPEDALPELGKTYALVGHEGVSDEFDQAVNVQTVDFRIATYGVPGQSETYQRKIVTVGISKPLKYTFVGVPVTRDEPSSESGIIRETVVSNAAARIFGISTVIQEVSPGDYTLTIDDPFEQIVPASERETAHTNITAAGNSALLVAAGSSVSFTTSLELSTGQPLYLGQPSLPGTVRVEGSGYTLTEIGGQLYQGSTVVGLVDSAQGITSLVYGQAPFSGPKIVTFVPAGTNSMPLQTFSIPITEASRRKTYSIHLPFPPAPLSVTVDFLVGDWYRFYETGGGLLKGAKDEWGMAQIDSENTLTITLGDYPDVGSKIIVSAGSNAVTIDRSATSLQKAYFEWFLSQPITPGQLGIAWSFDGQSFTASDDLEGNIVIRNSSNVVFGSGKVVYSLKRVRLYPDVLPPKSTVFTFTNTPTVAATETIPVAMLLDGLNPIQFDLQHGDIVPRTVHLSISGMEMVEAPVYSPVTSSAIGGK